MTDNAPRHESQVAYHRRRLNELKSIRSPWEAIWQSLADFIEPTRYRPFGGSEGPKSRASIIDSSGTFALNTLASGMHSGITSPARPWFKLATFDPDLKEYGPVKNYLSQVEKRMREVFGKSNIYPAFHQGYGDLGQFGQSCGILVEDEKATVRMLQLLHGRFWIARDENGIATTLYRQFTWSVQRIVSRFGYAKCSQVIKSAYDQGNYDKTFDIGHAVEPRLNRDQSKIDKANKRFLSNYWEVDHSGERDLLEESGFDENPIIAPAWSIAGEDHYGVSPGQIVLGDIRMLQKEQRWKAEGIEKIVRPPMTGPTSMKNNPISLLPGEITFVDVTSGSAPYRPAIEVNLRLGELNQDIRDVQNRIDRGFYADLFLMLANMEGVQPRNVLEIAERKEEKLLALGPVLENIYNGQLAPTIDRTFAILERRGELPPPPPELQGQDLQIEYTSILAQAQKAVSTGAIERISSFVGNLAAVKPEVLDKFDADQAVDVYAEAVGADPSLIVSDDDVKAVREGRAQQMQQAQQMEAAATMAPAVKQGAEAARLLSETDQGASGPALLQSLGLS